MCPVKVVIGLSSTVTGLCRLTSCWKKRVRKGHIVCQKADLEPILSKIAREKGPCTEALSKKQKKSLKTTPKTKPDLGQASLIRRGVVLASFNSIMG